MALFSFFLPQRRSRSQSNEVVVVALSQNTKSLFLSKGVDILNRQRVKTNPWDLISFTTTYLYRGGGAYIGGQQKECLLGKYLY